MRPIKLIRTILLIISPMTVLAQGVRVDSNAYTVSGNVPVGASAPVLAVPGATLNVCQDAACSIAATTYTDYTLATPCPANAQIVLAGTTGCIQTTPQNGAYGFWVSPGTYYYKAVLPSGQVLGPYPFLAFGPAGGYIFDANYPTLAAACTAAGRGALYITKVWTGLTATNTAACVNTPMTFLGIGKLQPANSQTITLSQDTQCPLTQQCYDESAGGVISFTNPPAFISPIQWGATGNGVSNDTAAFVSAQRVASGQTVTIYIPCGKFLHKPFAFYGAQYTFQGQGVCTVLAPFDNTSATASVTFASDVTFASYIGQVNVRDMVIEGALQNTYSVQFQNLVNSAVQRVSYSIANSTTGYCALFVNLVADTIDNNACAAADLPGGVWPGGTIPAGGFIFDGGGALSGESSTTTINSITAQALGSGKCLWLKTTALLQFNSTQVGGCTGTNLQIEPQSNYNTFVGGLIESAMGVSTKEAEIYGLYNKFIGLGFFAPGNNIHLYSGANNNVFEGNTVTTNVLIDSGAHQTNIHNMSGGGFGTGGSQTFTDNSHDSVYNYPAFWSFTTNLPEVNVPMSRSCSPIAQFSGDPTCTLQGTWYANAAAPTPIIDPTPYTTGKAWRMVLTGSWLTFGNPVQNCCGSPMIITDTQNVVTLFSTTTLTFTVNGSGYLQMAGANIPGGGAIGFTGTIQFMPASNITAGGLTGVSLNVSGSTVLTGMMTFNSVTGHLETNGAAPTVTAGGGSGCSRDFGNDISGRVTCTGAGTATVTWANAYSDAVYIVSGTAGPTVTTAGGSTMVVTVTGSGRFEYFVTDSRTP